MRLFLRLQRRCWHYYQHVLVMRAFSTFTGLLVLASRIVCLLVVAWFVVFAIAQSSKASTAQSNAVAAAASQPASTPAPAHESSLKRTLNRVAKAVTSPFSGITSGVSNAWMLHGEDTLLTLLIYGVGFGLVMRIVRFRV